MKKRGGLASSWRVLAWELIVLGTACARVAASATETPDLTQAQAVDHSQTHTLGATGLRGWIHTGAAFFAPTAWPGPR